MMDRFAIAELEFILIIFVGCRCVELFKCHVMLLILKKKEVT